MQERRLTYLDRGALLDLAMAVRQLETRHTPGALIEAGTALGGSAAVLAHAKAQNRPLYLFDVFGTIPPPSERDGQDVHARYETIARGDSPGIGGDRYYGYVEDLRSEVVNNLRSVGIDPEEESVELIEGLFEDTMPEHIRFPVALAHLDSDWYDSTMVCLRTIGPHLIVGGRFVVDDYNEWSGCRAAVDDFLAATPGYRPERHRRLHLVKT